MIRTLNSIDSEKSLLTTVFKEDVRYFWVDEDGKPVRVTPFNDFANALTWFQRWHGRYRTLDQKLSDHTRNYVGWQTERWQKELESMTATGKPPVTLMRVILKASVSQVSEAEQKIINDSYNLDSAISELSK